MLFGVKQYQTNLHPEVLFYIETENQNCWIDFLVDGIRFNYGNLRLVGSRKVSNARRKELYLLGKTGLQSTHGYWKTKYYKTEYKLKDEGSFWYELFIEPLLVSFGPIYIEGEITRNQIIYYKKMLERHPFKTLELRV